MGHMLEEWIEPQLDSKICNRYWHLEDDHADFRAIIDAINIGGGQTTDIPGIFRELDKAGYIICKMVKK